MELGYCNSSGSFQHILGAWLRLKSSMLRQVNLQIWIQIRSWMFLILSYEAYSSWIYLIHKIVHILWTLLDLSYEWNPESSVFGKEHASKRVIAAAGRCSHDAFGERKPFRHRCSKLCCFCPTISVGRGRRAKFASRCWARRGVVHSTFMYISYLSFKIVWRLGVKILVQYRRLDQAFLVFRLATIDTLMECCEKEQM